MPAAVTSWAAILDRLRRLTQGRSSLKDIAGSASGEFDEWAGSDTAWLDDPARRCGPPVG
ncbi:hypothetical protein BMG523Draft_01659 [Frankia sp. BMG5.23]|nr:hypothetical protein BMG523Draft_01659 [Frankia sp. BMG5.23]